MGWLGIRVVRIYTIHPPAFYAELARHNAENPDRPLYLMQGVYLPDESYIAKQNLYDPAVTMAFQREIADAAAAVSGRLTRPTQRGRAGGIWNTDVTPWLIGWIVGVEMDPYAGAASDRRNARRPATDGRYFRSTPDATPTERWLAARMDELAGYQAGAGLSQPIAFVNWPTTDPLRHPEEPLAQEDLLQLDANHVRPTPAWPIPSTGEKLPAELQNAGLLRYGTAEADSRNLWQLDGDDLVVRVPWALPGYPDPSTHKVGMRRSLLVSPGVGVSVSASRTDQPTGTVTWVNWNRPYYTERLKRGAGQFRDAAVDTVR